jgi:hypothetical protein
MNLTPSIRNLLSKAHLMDYSVENQIQLTFVKRHSFLISKAPSDQYLFKDKYLQHL